MRTIVTLILVGVITLPALAGSDAEAWLEAPEFDPDTVNEGELTLAHSAVSDLSGMQCNADLKIVSCIFKDIWTLTVDSLAGRQQLF